MRALAILLAFTSFGAACSHGGQNATPSTLPSRETPATDLATATHAPRDPATTATGNLVVKDPRVIDLDVIRIRAVGKGVGGDVDIETTSTTQLFNDATAAAKAGRTEEAMTKLRALIAEFPDSGLAPVALFDIAAIFDGRGDPTSTIDTLRELIEKYPDARESIDGHLYIAALQADHAQYLGAIVTIDDLLVRSNLTYADKLEAGARKGYCLIELSRLDDAEIALDAAIAQWRAAPHMEDPFYIAMASYYKGEVAHRRFLAAPVRQPDDQMVKDLETKRVLVVTAYDRWRDALGFKQPYWSTAAGYEMSQIFVELWEATVKAPWPARVDVATRPAYLADLHDRARDNLSKALDGHRMNLELAKAYGVDTDWSRGSANQISKIMDLLSGESRGTFVTPDQAP